MTVIDVNEADFQAQVLYRSATVPVVVDFWAEWCGPCRALGPLLEAEAQARDGDVVLAKIDTDANQGLAERFGIQGIPAVKAFRHGQVVAEFVGALPRDQVKSFFDALLPAPPNIAEVVDEDELRKLLAETPGHADAALALATLLYHRGDVDEALQLVRGVPDSFQAEGLTARIELERADKPELADVFAAIDKGQADVALDGLLAAIGAAGAQRDNVRRVIVAILDALGADHPLARDARRRLASALY